MGSMRLVCFSVACCLAVVAAQTFQYSRGWTNGRKRAAFLGHSGHQRAAEVAVKRAVAILEDAGLQLVPATCDSAPFRQGYKIVQRRTLQEEDEGVRGQDSLAAPPPSTMQQAAPADPSAADVAPGGGDQAAAFAF